MTLHRQFVVRMHLHGEVLARVDKFHEQGEVIAEFLIDFLAYKQFLVLVNQFYKRQALINIIDQAAIDSDALMSWHATDFPTLAHIGLRVENAFERCNLIAAPNGGLQIRLEFVRFHKSKVVEE